MVRTRFAPSPTGYLHVGGLRTALYAYLFAKANRGKFLLRIEDTDQTRFVEGAMENLIHTLNTVGMNYDEGPFINDGKVENVGPRGPYIQSQRTELYRQHCAELIEKEAAYPCFCTAERLEEMREKQMARKLAPMYDRTCLNLSKEEIEAKKAAGTPFVIRQKIPHGKKLKFKDLIRGMVQFDTTNIDDQVLMKSDNFPTYHLANVVDDHLMQITHVIRGEEWLPSTPKHLLLYEAFGWNPPEYAHLPLLLNKDKTKLSKRQGDVSVESYLQNGYSIPAILNFVALLGWHPGNTEQEIFSLEELEKVFTLEKVHKSGAIFDLEKLAWFNFQWQKKAHQQDLIELAKKIDPSVKTGENQKKEPTFEFSSAEFENKFIVERGKILFEMCQAFIKPEWQKNKDQLLKALTTVEEKILRLPKEVASYIGFYFEMKDYDLTLMLSEKMKVDKDIATKALTEASKVLADETLYVSQAKLQEVLIKLVADLGLKNGQLLWPLRVALSGEQFSPGVFELLWVLGKEESLKRINSAFQKLNA